jgi:hypothetical protein
MQNPKMHTLLSPLSIDEEVEHHSIPKERRRKIKTE